MDVLLVVGLRIACFGLGCLAFCRTSVVTLLKVMEEDIARCVFERFLIMGGIDELQAITPYAALLTRVVDEHLGAYCLRGRAWVLSSC